MKKQLLRTFLLFSLSIWCILPNSFAQISCNPGSLTFDQTITFSGASVQDNNIFEFDVCSGWNITDGQITIMVSGDLDGDNGQDERWIIGTEFAANAFDIGNTGNPLDQCDNTITSGPFGLSPLALSSWNADGTITFNIAATPENMYMICSNPMVSFRLELCYTECAPPVASCLPAVNAVLDATNPTNITLTPADIHAGITASCGIESLQLGSAASYSCMDIGQFFPVTLIVTDNCGQTDNCQTTVSVVDALPPVAVCNDLTIQLDVTGTGFAFAINALNPVMGVGNGSSDNCGGFNATLSQGTFTCADIGIQTVTLTVTDNVGLTDNCVANLTIEDNVNPQVVCASTTLQLDNNGNATLNPNDAVFAINEACTVAMVTASQTLFTCANITTGFPNIVTIEVTDQSNNMGFCNANIFVEDNVNPIAICSNITLPLNQFGSANITPAQIGGNSTDNCTITGLMLDNVNFMCADIGQNTVTLTVTDQSNNSSTCTAVVTVIDQTPPTPVCQNFTVSVDANGLATINFNNIVITATDNCGVLPGGQLTQDAFNCSELGANTVTASVTDVNGLTGSCQSTVIVVDLIPPTALCQDLTIDLDANGNATISPTQIDNGSNDNCNMITFSVFPSTFTCSNVGGNVVTLTVNDQSSNASTCNATVTVRDVTNPIALCQDATIFLDENGEATLTPNQIDNGSNDACGIASLALSKTAFDCSNIGSNTVVLTVTDNNGNISTCSANATVVDAIPAVILCRPSINTVNEPGVCGAEVILLPPVVIEENCSIVNVSNNAPNPFPIGTTTVTWTLTDAGGNPTSCLQNVTVNDTEAPEIECGASFVAHTSADNCGYPSYLLTPATATDNCSIMSITNDAPNFFPPGQYMVNYTATDFSGNSATCMQWVKIFDTTLPKLNSCPGDQIVEATNDDGAEATWPLPTAIDNCPGDIIWISSHNPGDFFLLGETEVTYTGFDQSGNSVECTFIIKVVPQPLPLTLQCLETIEISTQQDIDLDQIVWNSPLVQSLCEECDILKDAAFEHLGQFEGHNYYVFNSDEMTYEEAQLMAEDLGGYLTIISSEKENRFLHNELEEGTTAWFGLHDLGNGVPQWSDGEVYETNDWQEDITLISGTATGFVLTTEGDWQIQPMDESNYFLFEIPCYNLEMQTDNADNIGIPGTTTIVTYLATDMCGHEVTCDFELVFTEETVDYCTSASIVTDEDKQHFINHLVLGDYTNESGNNDGYGDFTDEYILLTPGEIVDFFANFGPLEHENPLYCRIWIDLNADGDFYDENELLGEAIDVLEMQDQLAVPFVDGSISSTRLRLAVSRFGYPEPCGAFENGEVEDYTVIFNHQLSACQTDVSLQGFRDGFSAQLSWVTQTNCQITTYDIERSTNGVDFEKIETDLADYTLKNIPEIYEGIDANPANGKNWYRLEVFPANSASFYTNVIQLKFNDEIQQITLYPNPADEYVNLHVKEATTSPATLQIFNTLGQPMYLQAFDELTSDDLQISLDGLVDGTYYVHLRIEGKRPFVQKLVVGKLNGFVPSAK